jgi:Mg2+/Co2+ transporter CorB
MNILWITLVVLVVMSVFFSSAETAMMSINRYRLRHLANANHRSARLVSKLLERTDRLLAVILIGNTFANILASAIATMIAVQLWGEFGVLVTSVVLALVILLLAEIMPKTFAAAYPERLAFFVVWPLNILLKLLYPLVWVANLAANTLLRWFHLDIQSGTLDRLNADELRTVVMESTGKISQHHQDLLLRILDLEKMTVDDVMIPRSDIVGIELDDHWEKNYQLLMNSKHTLLPIYRDGIDNVQGVINTRKVLLQLSQGERTQAEVQKLIQDAYFIPAGTPLGQQILNFRREKQRWALVVDEYGDIQGLVTAEDIVDEIVGELTPTEQSVNHHIRPQADGSFLVKGNANIRELNRLMHWELPTEGAKTLSGVIVEHIEGSPQAMSCVLIHHYPIEIIEVKDNLVILARISKRLVDPK